MPPFKDLSGKRFGHLTVIKRIENKISGDRERIQYLCKCDCGNEVKVIGENLPSKKSTTCGKCKYHHNRLNNSFIRPILHGLNESKIYNAYVKMIYRCYDKKDKRYPSYGARGITVCDEWLNHENYDGLKQFYMWAIFNGYRDDLTLDRINVDGNYCPENCRWVSYLIQANNKTTNIYFEYDGVNATLAEWCNTFGVPYKSMWYRIHTNNYTFEDAIFSKNHNFGIHYPVNCIYYLDTYNRPISMYDYDILFNNGYIQEYPSNFQYAHPQYYINYTDAISFIDNKEKEEELKKINNIIQDLL